MQQLITKSQFHDAFKDMGRSDQFSYQALNELYNYLTMLEEDTGQPIELDVIALCCEFSEEEVYDVLDNYGLEDIDELEQNTTIVWHDQVNATVLYQVY